MNKKTITTKLFIDMDEMQLLEIKERVYINENKKEVKEHYVQGILKGHGGTVILYVESESGKPDKCYQWIQEHWIKEKERKGFLGI